jgi:two-component sensor histidine kinase
MNVSILKTELRSEHDVMLARQRARQIAGLIGFDTQDQTRIATAVSEIARNAVQYAGHGKVEFRLTSGVPQALQIRIQDDGPGIADLDCLLARKGVADFGRGDSLRGVRRLMDLFQIETSPNGGTLVTLGKRRPRLLDNIVPKDMARISAELTQRVSEDPLAEMQRQNQELLHTLEELRNQQEERAEHLREIEALNQQLRRAMVETHHRVKNNLQVISALIEIQKQTGQESVAMSEVIRVGQNIQALGIIHDLLTQEAKAEGDASRISVKGVLVRLVPLLQISMGERRIRLDLDELALPGKQATALALVANELISNATKHGRGDVGIRLSNDLSCAVLEVCDDGPGFPTDFDPQTAAHTGLELIDNIVRYDLQGKASFENRPHGGGRVVLSFPVS